MSIKKALLMLSVVVPLLCLGHGAATAQQSFGIAATVNKDAISEADLGERMKLILISAGLQNTAENRDKARAQALNSLIEEQLKIQEADRQGLSVTPEEVGTGFEAIAQQNNLDAESFSKMMAQQGLPKSTLLNQIKSQISWSKVIGKVLRPQIEVSENDINAKLERIKSNMGKTEYQVSEIFLPVNSGDEETKTQQLATKLIEEIKKGARFSVVAAQFSKAASAENGGSMGWVQEGDLPKELDVVIKSLSVGQISPPIRGLSGFYIMALQDKRLITQETLPSEDEVLNAIGLERLDRLQQRYLSDIRSAAFIDKR